MLTGGPVQTSDTNGGAIPGAKTTNAPGSPSNAAPQPIAPAAKGGDATQIPAVVSAPAVVVPQADSQIPQPTTTTNAGGTKDDKGDDDASVSAIAAPPASPSQPLAAAIVVNIPAAASARCGRGGCYRAGRVRGGRRRPGWSRGNRRADEGAGARRSARRCGPRCGAGTRCDPRPDRRRSRPAGEIGGQWRSDGQARVRSFPGCRERREPRRKRPTTRPH